MMVEASSNSIPSFSCHFLPIDRYLFLRGKNILYTSISLKSAVDLDSDALKVSKEMKLLKVGSYFYLVLCVIGCALHIWLFAKEYFAYRTNSDIAPIIPTTHPPPNLSLCFSLSSLIKFEEKNDSKGIEYFEDGSTVNAILSMTTDQLFAATPNASDVIDMCSYVFNTQTRQFYRENCSKFFSVLKYQMLGYMCYKVGVADTYKELAKTIEFNLIGNSIQFEQNKFFSFSLHHSSFTNNLMKFLPIVHVDELPYISRRFSLELLSYPGINNSFRANFDIFRITKLPPPYESMCRHHDVTTCFYDCISNESTVLGLKDQEAILIDPNVKLRLFTEYDTSNRGMMNRIRKKCHQKCGKKSCYREYTASFLVHSRLKYKLAFKIVPTTIPIIQVIHSPRMSIYKFLTDVGCLFGIWLCACVLGLFEVLIHLLPGAKDENEWTRMHTSKLSELHNRTHFLHQKFKRFRITSYWSIRYSQIKQINKYDWTINHLVGKSRLYIFLSNIFIVALFLYHLIWISEMYFAYGTLMQLTRETEEVETTGLKFDLCFYSYDLNKQPYPKVPTTTHFHQQLSGDNWTDLTLGEMFNRQFNKSKVVSSCAVRNLTSNQLQFYPSFDECSQHLDISTFYMFHSMCSAIQVKSNPQFDHKRIKFSFINPFTIFSVTSNLSEFKGNCRIRTIIHRYGLPIISRNFVSDTYFTEPNRTFIISYFTYHAELLPSPYDTRCSNSNYNVSTCLVENTSKRLGYLPHSEIYRQSDSRKYEEKKFLSYKLLSNESVSRVYEQIEDHCDEVAKDTTCNTAFTKTVAYLHFSTTTLTTFSVQTPMLLTIHAIAIPRVRLTDFLYDIACCLSFWFGLSVASLNPFVISMLFLRRKGNKVIVKKLNETSAQLNLMAESLREISVHYPKLFLTCMGPQHFFKRLLAKITPARIMAMLCIGLILIPCCCIHLAYLTRVYFSYLTVLNTYMLDEKFNVVPSSIVCIKHNWHKLIANDTEALLTETIFNWTPHADKLLSSCGGRGLPVGLRNSYSNISSYALDRIYTEDISGTNCSHYFGINKFFMNNQICYRMKFKNKIKPKYNEFRSLRLPGYIYDFGLGEHVTFDSLSVIIAKEKPYTSRLFPLDIPGLKERKKWLMLSYIKYSTKCMPLPYDQKNYPDMEFDECTSLCMAKAANATGWAFPTVVINDPRSKLKVMNHFNLFNRTDDLLFKQFYKQCKVQCKFHRNCNEYFTYYITYSHIASKWHEFSLWLRRADYPETRVVFLARMRLCDWILEVGNVVSIWLGICVLAINPCNLLKKSSKFVLNIDSTDKEMIRRLEGNQRKYWNVKPFFDKKCRTLQEIPRQSKIQFSGKWH